MTGGTSKNRKDEKDDRYMFQNPTSWIETNVSVKKEEGGDGPIGKEDIHGINNSDATNTKQDTNVSPNIRFQEEVVRTPA